MVPWWVAILVAFLGPTGVLTLVYLVDKLRGAPSPARARLRCSTPSGKRTCEMRKSHERPPISAIILVVELAQRVDKEGWHWDVVLSRATSESTFIRTWDNPGGRLAEPQALDLQAFVAQSITDCLLDWGGIQGVMEA